MERPVWDDLDARIQSHGAAVAGCSRLDRYVVGSYRLPDRADARQQGERAAYSGAVTYHACAFCLRRLGCPDSLGLLGLELCQPYEPFHLTASSSVAAVLACALHCSLPSPAIRRRSSPRYFPPGPTPCLPRAA